MIQLNPYVRFNDAKCAEAMDFYKSCLGGELSIQTVGQSAMAKEMDASKQNLIMHATLKGDGFELFAADMMRDKATVGDNISLSLNLSDKARAEDIFAKLGNGGEIFMPLEKVFWGDIFGMLTDKFGVEWMVNCSDGEKK